jgi:hypothetical protein
MRLNSSHISNCISSPHLEREMILELNKYHNDPSKESKYEAIRAACDQLMVAIVENCPCCADRTRAINEVRSARMWANSSIALDEVQESC